MCKSGVGTAPGKVILFGEHAVVYGQPAIAVPIHRVQATATVATAQHGQGLTLFASDLDRVISLETAQIEDPLAKTVNLVLSELDVLPPDVTITVKSTIPIASGLGSGTAVSAAIVRAMGSYFGREFPPSTVSRLVFEVEKLYHGTPSGIDNTVVSFGSPVFFEKGRAIEILELGTPLHLLIGDTGVASSTRAAVDDVRTAWRSETARHERTFAQIGRLVLQARTLIETGDDEVLLGKLMDRNHILLRELGVSCLELDRLTDAARAAGALGAKLSGAGRGGNMVALASHGSGAAVVEGLRQAGAVRVIETIVSALTADGAT